MAAEAAPEQREAGKAPTEPGALAARGARAPQGRINDFCAIVKASQYDCIVVVMNLPWYENIQQLSNGLLLSQCVLPSAAHEPIAPTNRALQIEDLKEI